ncbi:MAG: hypothetical protein JNJ54_01230 [Myxococcaceae bacterium]|nr:hypothetical protein [Myxococcaceae bacterium]
MTPLIRTEGKTYQTGYALSVDRLLAEEPLRVESRDDTARAAEAALRLPPSLYFYVGHACPAFGALVLVYELERIADSVGSASDHDTGGLHAGHIHFDPELSSTERIVWSGAPAHRWALPEVPERFLGYVASWFESDAAYFTGRRAVRNDEVGRLLHARNERRAWTVEVRLENDHALLEGVRLIGLSPAAHEAVRHAMATNPGLHQSWERLLDEGLVRAFDPATMHTEVERLVASGALS